MEFPKTANDKKRSATEGSASAHCPWGAPVPASPGAASHEWVQALDGSDALLLACGGRFKNQLALRGKQVNI